MLSEKTNEKGVEGGYGVKGTRARKGTLSGRFSGEDGCSLIPQKNSGV